MSQSQPDTTALRKALERSVIAIDDWLHVYAGEFCDPERVKEAEKRIGEYGTLSYIAHVQEQNRAALSIPDPAVAPLEPSVEAVRKTVADEWGSHLCWQDRDTAKRTCDKDKHCRCADIARAVISQHALPSEAIGREWQPIETAPRDGTPIDLFSHSNHRWCNYRWDTEIRSGMWSKASCAGLPWEDRPSVPDENMTHWMPLPAGPMVSRPHHSSPEGK